MERLKPIIELVGEICDASRQAHRDLMDRPCDDALARTCQSLETVRDTIHQLDALISDLRTQRNAGIGLLRVQDHRKMTMAEIAELAGVDDSTATDLATQAGFPERRTKRGSLCTDGPAQNGQPTSQPDGQQAAATR